MSITWTDLHDSTLESLELSWSSGEVFVHLQTGDARHPRRVLVASEVRRVECSRLMPWGPSASINEVRGPTRLDAVTTALEIEMQSGDLIRIEAIRFELRDGG